MPGAANAHGCAGVAGTRQVFAPAKSALPPSMAIGWPRAAIWQGCQGAAKHMNVRELPAAHLPPLFGHVVSLYIGISQWGSASPSRICNITELLKQSGLAKDRYGFVYSM
jgi:hypothetical protein